MLDVRCVKISPLL